MQNYTFYLWPPEPGLSLSPSSQPAMNQPTRLLISYPSIHPLTTLFTHFPPCSFISSSIYKTCVGFPLEQKLV